MLQVIIGIVGSLVYLYLCWRTMKENYREEDMIAFGWVSLLTYLIGSRILFSWSELVAVFVLLMEYICEFARSIAGE